MTVFLNKGILAVTISELRKTRRSRWVSLEGLGLWIFRCPSYIHSIKKNGKRFTTCRFRNTLVNFFSRSVINVFYSVFAFILSNKLKLKYFDISVSVLRIDKPFSVFFKLPSLFLLKVFNMVCKKESIDVRGQNSIFTFSVWNLRGDTSSLIDGNVSPWKPTNPLMSDEIYLRAIYRTASPVKVSECLRLNHLSLSYEQFEQPFTAKNRFETESCAVSVSFSTFN